MKVLKKRLTHNLIMSCYIPSITRTKAVEGHKNMNSGLTSVWSEAGVCFSPYLTHL